MARHTKHTHGRDGTRASGAKSGRVTVAAHPAEPPPRERLRKGKTIRIGDVESLPRGRELRCFIEGNRVVVAVFDADRPCEPTLSISSPPTTRALGHAFDEGEFSRVLDSYRINSPWHDGEYTCMVLTIDCLRRGDEHELLVFKDL